MRSICYRFLFPCLLGVLFLTFATVWAQHAPTSMPTVSPGKFSWQVVVNNGMTVPNDTRKFNSYNQPSVNFNQVVVFRARSKGGTSGEPAQGVFVRNMALKDSSVELIFDRKTEVPQPNDLHTMFTEPPSFPRIDMRSDAVVSRGNHQPVWEYLIGHGINKTRAGTTGIYYRNLPGLLITGASNLGAVPDFLFFAVPGTNPPIKFDVFPGAPSVTESNMIVFKGNYSVPGAKPHDAPISKTGVYFRTLTPTAPAGGDSRAVVIADTDTLIPETGKEFGSLAPPSAAGFQAVFAGFDNEDNPTLGGIYLAPLSERPQLTTLVKIGGQVPGEKDGSVFNKLGESISFDGRFVAFWGAWGSETKTVTLYCPTEGNKDRIAYCNQQYPKGYRTTVPVNQGIFVYDIQSGQTWPIAKTPDNFTDFVYWKFTGVVPGMGESEETGEPARWRSESLVAVSGMVADELKDNTFDVAFEARTGQLANGAYENPIDGIYLFRGPGGSPITAAVQTGTDGTQIDPEAKLDGNPLPVTEVGIERDGFRGNNLVINVRMGTEEAGWAGIYLTTVP